MTVMKACTKFDQIASAGPHVHMSCQFSTRVVGDSQHDQGRRLGCLLYQKRMAQVDWCMGMLCGAWGSLVWDNGALVGLVTELERPLPACQVYCENVTHLTSQVPSLQQGHPGRCLWRETRTYAE